MFGDSPSIGELKNRKQPRTVSSNVSGIPVGDPRLKLGLGLQGRAVGRDNRRLVGCFCRRPRNPNRSPKPQARIGPLKPISFHPDPIDFHAMTPSLRIRLSVLALALTHTAHASGFRR